MTTENEPRDERGRPGDEARLPGDELGPPEDEVGLRSSYASFLARLEAGEKLDFETWLHERGEDGSDDEALRSLHRECAALEATLERIAAENPPETLFFQPSSTDTPGAPRAPDVRRPAAGLRIGEYRLIARLGKGGMGEVWEAVHFGLQRRVALKLLDPERFTERGVRFFDREARAGARVNEPGIVAVHAAGEDDGFLWIDQELVEGGRTLADFLREMRAREVLPEDYHHRVARFVADAARSMQVAHDQFVVHRDLKPGNILIGAGDQPKITDFGLARITDEQSVSRSGDLVGTYQYMSPEQISRGKHRADHRTDVFSLGVVLYELLTLQRPFEADSTQELIARILHYREPDPCALRDGVPRELGTICVRALQKSPGDRFASMTELADELERWLGGLPIHTRRPGAFTTLALWRRRNQTLAASLGVALLAVLPLLAITLRLVASERNSRYREQVSEIRLAGFSSDLVEVLAAHGRAQELDPEDPEASLAATVGALLCQDVPAAKALLSEALARGFDPAALDPRDAQDQYLFGYYLLLSEPPQEGAQLAREAFERVLELDEDNRGAFFGLYTVSMFLEDIPAARSWLERYRGRMENDDPGNAVVEALALELQGDNAGALERLQALLDEPQREQEQRRLLSVPRLLGRVALYQGEYERALGALRTAVTEFPDDAVSWSNLAVAAYKAMGTSSGGERAARIAEARAAAERGRELEPQKPRDRLTLLALELWELERELDGRVLVEPARWTALERMLDELEQMDVDPVLIAELRSEVFFLQAWDAVHADDLHAALSLFELALEADPSHVRAHLFLAQKLLEALGTAELDRILEHLELGLEALEGARDPQPVWAGARRIQRDWAPSLEASLQTWITWAAAASGDVDRALAARDAVEILLEGGGPAPEPSELLTYAEGLATLPDEFVAEHGRAREIVEEHGLQRLFGGDPEGQPILDFIATAGR